LTWITTELSQIFVDPDYQGQGVGRLLVEWGIQQIGRGTLYVEATPAGKGLYEGFGFTVEHEVLFPEIQENGEPWKMYIMLRKIDPST
jgi:ribosomal protein S18 acetylase RimI-like enzyme